MTRRVALLAVLALLAMSGGGQAPAFHKGRCPKAGLPAMPDPGTVDTLADDEIHSYKLKVPKGQQAFVNLQPINGDVDIEVCKGKQRASKHVCSSHNPYPFFDGCHFPELALPCAICVGGETTYGPPLGPGTYRVDVHQCFTRTVDDCDYSFGVVPPEVFDQLTTVGYVLTVTFSDTA